MATTLAADAIPRFIVIKSESYSDKGHAYFKAEGSGGSVVLGEADVFSTLVKMEAERSAIGNKYINLRFCYSNRYWVRKANSNLIVAEFDQPDEDTTKPTCTLFEPVKVDDFFYLIHVQSGGRVLMDSATSAFYVEPNPGSDQGYLTIVDWDSLVKLPPRVAFKGDNGKYLFNPIFLPVRFISDDPNSEASIYEVEQSPDGNVRIRWAPADEQYFFYLRDDGMILTSPNSQGSQFLALKIDENSIALRSIDNKQFCQRLSSGLIESIDSLSASAPTITKQAIIQVQELVLERKMSNVTYQMEYGRIFNEQPYLAGSSTMTNDKDEESSMAVEIGYEDVQSSTFTGGFSLTAGVSASIEAGVPFIEKATITVNYSATATFEWAKQEQTSKSVKATGSVPVPGRSTVVVDYVGTMGTCNIPFSYTRADKSSIDAHTTTYTDVSDGIYTGVNCYNFNFHIRSTEPL